MAISSLTPLFPRQVVPALSVPLAGGGRWSLAEQNPENFTLVVFYRGLHCPICAKYLNDLDSKVEAFAKHGVTAIAISGDDAGRAETTKTKWRLPNLALGYGLDLDTARRWGLYISAGHGTTSAGVPEPPLFIEPGIFLVRADGTLYFSSVQTMPFARPHFADILTAVEFVVARSYPARGEVTDPIMPASAA